MLQPQVSCLAMASPPVAARLSDPNFHSLEALYDSGLEKAECQDMLGLGASGRACSCWKRVLDRNCLHVVECICRTQGKRQGGGALGRASVGVLIHKVAT